MLARIIAKPINKVRFIMSPVGGGFGGKEDMIYQGMLALMAMKTRRPVRYVYTREESIISTAKRHPSRTTLKMGLTRDGRIRAVEFKMICDGGAYGLSTEGVMRKAAILGAGPYNVPNLKMDIYGVYTNNTPSGAFRSFGALQTAVRNRNPSRHLRRKARARSVRNPPHQRHAGRRDHPHQAEAQIGEPAARARRRRESFRLGKRRAGFARRRAQRPRRRRHAAAVRARQRALRRRQSHEAARSRDGTQTRTRHGGCWYGIARTATVDRAGAWAEIDDGGTAKIVTGVTEIGEGILTVLAQIAAHEIGIRPQDVTIGDNDTARAPEAAHAGASRQTYMIGNVVALAARQARAQAGRGHRRPLGR